MSNKARDIRLTVTSRAPSRGGGRLARWQAAALAVATGLAAGIGLVGVGGCAGKPAAATPLVADPLEPRTVGILSDAQRGEVMKTFAQLAAGETASAEPMPADSPRGRWSDVHYAVLYACDEVEAAVVRRAKHDWGWEYALRTAEDWPGTLIIRRADEQRVYEASAVIGVFGDRTDRAAALLKAFEQQMRDFGRKRQFPDLPGQ